MYKYIHKVTKTEYFSNNILNLECNYKVVLLDSVGKYVIIDLQDITSYPVPDDCWNFNQEKDIKPKSYNILSIPFLTGAAIGAFAGTGVGDYPPQCNIDPVTKKRQYCRLDLDGPVNGFTFNYWKNGPSNVKGPKGWWQPNLQDLNILQENQLGPKKYNVNMSTIDKIDYIKNNGGTAIRFSVVPFRLFQDYQTLNNNNDICYNRFTPILMEYSHHFVEINLI